MLHDGLTRHCQVLQWFPYGSVRFLRFHAGFAKYCEEKIFNFFLSKSRGASIRINTVQ